MGTEPVFKHVQNMPYAPKKLPRTKQELTLEFRRDLGLLDNEILSVALNDAAQDSDVLLCEMGQCFADTSPAEILSYLSSWF